MPLNHPPQYNVLEAPYELKVQIIEHNCSMCDYFLHYDDDEQIPVLGCVYPHDIRGSHEPFLSLIEIAHNSCDFWKQRFLTQEPYRVDATPGNWNDPLISPEKLWLEELLTTQKPNSNLSGPSSMSPAQKN